MKAELWGFSRAVKADIEELVRLGLRASIIEAPTSDIKLKAYGMSRDEVLRRISDSVSFARKNAIAVAFFAVDGTRTELDFLKKVCLAALDAGGRELVVVDTIGACGPEAAEFLVREVCNWAGPRTPVHWHGHNDFGMATACAVAAVRGGASWIQGTINGMGERAGNADIGEIALACVLLVGAGLLMRSFVRLLDVDLGFQPGHTAIWTIDMPASAASGRSASTVPSSRSCQYRSR